MPPVILLSHHRTGSTAIRRALESRFRVYPGEPLLPFLDGDAQPTDDAKANFTWEKFFIDHHEWQVLHFHRHHVDTLDGWTHIAKHAAGVIRLTRQSQLHQALSLRRAIKEQVWYDHPLGHSHDDYISLNELETQMIQWALLEAKGEFHFRYLPDVRITYEEFCRDPELTVDRLASFVASVVESVSVA